MGAPIHPPTPENIRSACDVLRSGGVVAYPTETVFGLAVDPFSEEALQRLFDIKGRRADQPVLLLIADRSDVGRLASPVTSAATDLMDRFWPGPLTILLPALPGLSTYVTSGSGTVALRQASPGAALDLVAAFGGPITSTSANRSGEPPATTSEQAAAILPAEHALVLDGRCAPDGVPSTIVDTTGETPRVVRSGAIPEADIGL